MKKIIGGKKYDTDTAKEVGSWDSSHSVLDFHYFREALYRKRTGEFFLYGEGGAMSRYAVHYGDGWGYGERIEPLTEEQARRWAEKRLDVETYEETFGEVEE